MSGCATPATQSAAASQAPNPGPSAPPSTISATPATQNDGGCEFVPRLPRETKVDVRLCHACHAKTTVDVSLCHACHVKRRWMSGCATPATQSAAASQAPNPGPRAPPSTISATPATQNDGRCDFVPRLPRETKVDVRLCHACHAKCRGVTGAKSRPKRATQYHKRTPATQNDGRCEFVPRLPRETKVDVRLCHACHAKCRGVTGAKSRPKGATQYHKCHACHAKTTVDVSLCHACHVKRRWMSGCATPATQSAAASQAPNPGPRAPPSTISATPATQNDGRCEFVPRLPRETKVDVRLCHACHAKCRGVTGAKSRPKDATQYHKCHACHAKRRWM